MATNQIHNNNCDGDHCRTTVGEVRVYPLGAGGNLILCRDCWQRENRYRRQRQREAVNHRRDPSAPAEARAKWPEENWHAAEVYAAYAQPRRGQA